MPWKSKRFHRAYYEANPESRAESLSDFYTTTLGQETTTTADEQIIYRKQILKIPNYQEYIEDRSNDIMLSKGTPEFWEGEDQWVWIKSDTGAWTGPATDWQREHSIKYFKHLKKLDCVITAGANQGMYVRHYAKKFGHVYAFEPDPLNFHVMSLNCQFDNVTKIMGAVGAEPGFCAVQRNGFENTGQWTINPLVGKTPVFTIDSFNFPVVDLLQLDIEGFEMNAITGAVNTITSCKPIVVLENGQRNDIKMFMGSLGYEQVEQSVSDAVYAPKS